jgi:hypothetical protein
MFSKITINETSRGRVPSCYAGKTFVLTFESHTDSQYGGFDHYVSTFKNGSKVEFTRFASDGKWKVNKALSAKGTWLEDVTVE